ncbi:hypothetical protein METBIDRAFT_205698 [Metschnikowia bicuspidata var. bicuspidata NRRL YB-4993]|uniref:Uncharacterized protein n=1 Tax=Metschnikowia bicuspidata var. bicuspidata NRRL YB-4993 TaxID=869754 RepID=A0A1A0H9T0_9ASCO|nr:hypothetical protein METBIDRAFT_205698 [Metschnikowia bicuspidata var. bicuspidata NRRL YB-4993]OBA20771.1 hypothetical protein METBIDRAFT_205698 [Metschnikowia bicuspidata var. bicuspidata NRRL YB-4993]
MSTNCQRTLVDFSKQTRRGSAFCFAFLFFLFCFYVFLFCFYVFLFCFYVILFCFYVFLFCFYLFPHFGSISARRGSEYALPG